jgi:hypothetical protein
MYINIMEDTTDQKVHDPVEEIWAMLRETDRIVKETAQQMKATDRQLQATDRQLQATDRQLQETDRKIGKLGNRFGDLVEHLVAPNLLEKFNALGYNFGRVSLNTVFKNPKGVFVAEVDILLENGDIVLAVEVKANLTIHDIREHMERMEKLRLYADEHGDKRQLVAATAGAIIAEGVKPFAFKNGFYVIEQAGDTVKIAIPEGFVPKKW